MRWKIWGLAATVAIVAPLMAQQGIGRERLLDRQCRRELVRLCGLDRSEMRACLRERADELSDGCKAQFAEGIAKRRVQIAPSAISTAKPQPVVYGASPKQLVDLYLPQGARPAGGYPLVIYVHGGGWRNGDRVMVQHKPDFFIGKGWAFASVGYRLLPEAPVEQQAADVAAAVRKLATDARALGIDPGRIILMGHSAGAHLSALISTDTAYLGTDMATLAGVILLDGAGYDVARQMRDQPMLSRSIYEPAFGTDPARQAKLSPLTHSAAPNVGHWLILHAARRQDAATQSRSLADALIAAGADVRVSAIEGENHMTINRELGAEDNAHTLAVEKFLAGF